MRAMLIAFPLAIRQLMFNSFHSLKQKRLINRTRTLRILMANIINWLSMQLFNTSSIKGILTTASQEFCFSLRSVAKFKG